MKNFLSKDEVIVLQEAHHAARDKRKADRIKTVLLLNQGYLYSEIAKILLLNDSTARNYFKEYQDLGLDGLVADNYSGSPSFLSVSETQELILHLKSKTFPAVKEVVFYVKQTYGKEYSVEGMTHLLHKLGFVYKKTKIIPGKLDPLKQAEFKEQYQTLKDNLKPGDKIHFLDASHPHHNNKASYGWIPKGEERWIKTNTGRQRVNINGALNLEDLTVVTRLEETINADKMILLIKDIEENQPQGEIYLILDNARYNHAIKVTEYVKQSGRIHLVFLPPYSPNLNIIERLWLFLHQKILYDKYYPTFSQFKEAVENFFKNFDQYQAELKTRLTDSFQTIPA